MQSDKKLTYLKVMILTMMFLLMNCEMLNHNLKSLKSKELPENNDSVKCHQHYYINDRKEAMKYSMINDINDLLQLKVDRI